MNLPPPVTKKPYNTHLKIIETASSQTALRLMYEATERLICITEKEVLDSIEEMKVSNASVTIDGTSQRRGHSSKMGVVLVISVRT